ncbi:flavin-containing monooxygenase FMO GS-OX-like 2 isoform X1 [Daucus carota subsp. sativus]|uniref:flavin-containing monooxygenase FMO GS-OX-like 2 isoform X1 n=1 Tax=Daucus carota subsp. sativus TaxID=79200 RepID=UPI0007EFEB19|nr:PREDICTED: flavin-containing monooxygenase FMO GS-OX-like 2 [Daucus carota subsp. sativus]
MFTYISNSSLSLTPFCQLLSMPCLNVAVIGAGVGGLCAGRELQRAGHRVTIFEKQNQLGGTWVYDPRVESDPLSLDPKREIIHSSLYASLRTNFPRHVMGFSDFPFTKIYEDSRAFPSHEEVLRFLNDFAEQFGLVELTRLNTEVVRVELKEDEWVVESRMGELTREEAFDAVVVCVGHHTEPRVANFPGIEKWPGKQIHSHNYRNNKPFRDQIVVVIGAGPSAMDISIEIAKVAREVHLSTRSSSMLSKLAIFAKLNKHPEIDYVDESGRVVFEDGSSVEADILFHCTGYRYNFPFLKTNNIVTVEDNRVGPLYKHVFPPELAPRLSFIGIPYATTGIPLMELQAKWLSLVLSGQRLLPSKETMMADTEDFYKSLELRGIPIRHTHSLVMKFEYPNWLADQLGLPGIDEQIKKIQGQVFKILLSSEGSDLREWDVDSWLDSIN